MNGPRFRICGSASGIQRRDFCGVSFLLLSASWQVKRRRLEFPRRPVPVTRNSRARQNLECLILTRPLDCAITPPRRRAP
jgi:hypothetical protein